PLAIDDKTLERAPPAAPTQPGEALASGLIDLQQRAEDAGQIADVFCDQEVMLHEAFDAAGARMIGVAHAAADLGLQVEGQPLLGAAGEIMKMAAHGP